MADCMPNERSSVARDTEKSDADPAHTGIGTSGVPSNENVDVESQQLEVGIPDSERRDKRKENSEHSEMENDCKKPKRTGSCESESHLDPSTVVQCQMLDDEVNTTSTSEGNQLMASSEGKTPTFKEGEILSSKEDDPLSSKEKDTSADVEDGDGNSSTDHACIVCWKSFTSAAILSVHVRSHENTKIYPCYKCRKSFKTPAALFRHEQTSLHNSDIAFSCEICLAMFETKKYLNRHIVRMHKKNHCEVCFKKFYTESELEDHDCERPKFPKFHCSGCIQVFPTEGRFVNHQKTTQYDHEMLFKCGICCLAFDAKKMYLKHMHGHMGGDGKPYVCGACNKGFDILANLELHMPRHKGNESLKCGVCDKRYEWPKKGYYKQHIHLHIGKTPYVCGICLMRYKNFSCVQNHLKVRHFSDRSCPEETTPDV